MTSNFKEKLKNLPSGNPEGLISALDQLSEILDLPDEKFDLIYPQLKEHLTNTLKSPGLQREMLKELENIPMQDEAGERAFINSIKGALAEEDYSDKKKDLLMSFFDGIADLTFKLHETPRERITVPIHIINKNATLPTYAHPTDAGADVYSAEDVTIAPGETCLVSTGLTTAVPVGYMIQIYPRSGLSVKTGLRIPNSVGIIDSDYRGEIKVCLTNTGLHDETIRIKDRIAQMIIAEAPMIAWQEVDSLDETARGTGGFGSTGKS